MVVIEIDPRHIVCDRTLRVPNNYRHQMANRAGLAKVATTVRLTMR